MTARERAELVCRLAADAGFERVGIAPAQPLPRQDYLRAWLAAGRAGEMRYLQRWVELRADPRNLLPGAHSVIVVAHNYRHDEGGGGRGAGGEGTSEPDTPARERSEPDAPARSEPEAPARESVHSSLMTHHSSLPTGRIAQYAWGRDYHRVIRKKLHRLVEGIRTAIVEPFEARVCVDTAPVLERELAAAAGIGWIAKNTIILHQGLGSFFFLGEVITTLELAASAPVSDHCGSCTRCLEACPTGALTAPRQMDATRCISYLTIEHRGEIAPELPPLMGGWVYGCDICQDVCPFNGQAPTTREPAYELSDRSPFPPRRLLRDLLAMTPEQYHQQLAGSAMKRATLPMLQRNAAIALANAEARG